MLQQFFGKPFLIVLAGLAGYFLLSIFVFQTAWALPVLFLTILGVAILTGKKLEWGLMAAFAELFGNSHGHLVSAPLVGVNVSSRMAVFGGVMLGYTYLLVTRQAKLPWKDARLTPFVLLAGAVGLGFLNGFMRNKGSDAFSDGNAYLYVAYVLPMLSVKWTVESKRWLLQTLAAGAAWASILTLGLLYVFTHFPEWMLSRVYTFVRDTRTGELTKMYGNLFRIFLQAQLSVIAFALLVTPLAFALKQKRERLVLLATFAVSAAVILIGLSRSFWVGILAGLVPMLALLVWKRRPSIRQAGQAVGIAFASLFLGTVGLIAIILFPLPYRVGSLGELRGLFSERTTNIEDVAISSRWNLLPEMVTVIKEHPLQGSGFGKIVSFITDDPRARAIYPDGRWRTYSLEWGWLELWLKMGVLGPIAFLWLFVAAVRGLWRGVSGEAGWLNVGLIGILTMLYATHVFSPYLNHPLGLGLILFVLPFMDLRAKQAVTNHDEEGERVDQVKMQPSMLPLTTEQ